MEAIGTLAGGIAHDFNNLLTVVIAIAGAAAGRKRSKAPEYAHIQKIFHAAENGQSWCSGCHVQQKSEPKPVPINLNKQVLQD